MQYSTVSHCGLYQRANRRHTPDGLFCQLVRLTMNGGSGAAALRIDHAEQILISDALGGRPPYVGQFHKIIFSDCSYNKLIKSCNFI